MPVCIVGDTHGNWDQIFSRLDQYSITNSYLIHVGDIGLGFVHPNKQNETLKLTNSRFKKRGIKFMGIRGNHDDPSFFRGDYSYSNMDFLPDYTLRELNGEKFLFVGGAISIDRQCRVLGQSYWIDESFVLRTDLAQKCDVLITHSAPYWLGPFDKQGIAGWCEKDKLLWDECYKERLELDELVKLCKPSRLYCGHFHMSSWIDHRECYARILDINEIAEHKPYDNGCQ